MRLFLFLFLLAPLALLAQPKDNSPYSRFGLGDVVPGFYGNQTGMGGISAGFADPFHINPVNPASYAALKSTAFEIGASLELSQLSSGNREETVFNGDLNYMTIGFPIRNPNNEIFDGRKKEVEWGMILGLARNTRVGYDVQTNRFTDGPDSLIAAFEGEGGTYRFTWGNAVRYKNFSAGLNIGTLFGRIQYERRLLFEDDVYAFANRFEQDQNLTGFLWDAGFQYKIPLKYNERDQLTKSLTVGVYGNATQSFRTNSTQVFEGENFGYGGLVDTSAFNTELRGEGQLPARFGIGFMYEHINRMRFGLDFQHTGWSGYENENRPETLENGMRLSIGGEIVPQSNRLKTAVQQIRYRFGAYFERDPRTASGNQLTDYGISIGTGIPVIGPRQALSHINLALEAGRFGTDDAIRENYLRMTIGLTLNDQSWFINRKFN